MEELFGESVQQQDRRCADCSIVIEKAENPGALCEVCGEPICQDCAGQHIAEEEPMVCVTCWESDNLASEE